MKIKSCAAGKEINKWRKNIKNRSKLRKSLVLLGKKYKRLLGKITKRKPGNENKSCGTGKEMNKWRKNIKNRSKQKKESSVVGRET